MSLNDLPTERIDPWLVTWDYGGETIQKIKEYAEEVHLKSGQTIFAAGQPSDAMYLVLEGMVLVLVKDSDGKEQTLSIVTEGQSFGEVGLLIKQSRLATTAAGLDTRLLKITWDTLEQLEKDRPDLLIPMYKALAQTLAEQWMLAVFNPKG